MYCIKCGAHLSDGQSVCPICSTRIVHPDFPTGGETATYPRREFTSEAFNRRGLLFVLTVFHALLILLPMLIEKKQTGVLAWSDYMAFGVGLFYILCILPFWFHNPNPVIFAPADIAAVTVFLLYVSIKTGGGWFMPFAFPVAGAFCLILTAVIALVHYLRRGRLYIFGGGLIALGALAVLIELLSHAAFEIGPFYFWSLYPLIALTAFGLMLIVIAIVKPLRESLRRFFFV